MDWGKLGRIGPEHAYPVKHGREIFFGIGLIVILLILLFLLFMR